MRARFETLGRYTVDVIASSVLVRYVFKYIRQKTYWNTKCTNIKIRIVKKKI